MELVPLYSNQKKLVKACRTPARPATADDEFWGMLFFLFAGDKINGHRYIHPLIALQSPGRHASGETV